MILPEGHESMTDEELIAALVEDGVAADRDDAEALVELARSGEATA